MTIFNRIIRQICSKKNLSQMRNLTSKTDMYKENKLLKLTCVIGGTIALYTAYRIKVNEVHASQIKSEKDLRQVKLTSREKRFIRFASVEYNGQLYMTPKDFLESVVEAEPRPRLKRKTLTDKEIEKMKEFTPPLNQGGSRLFRSLRDKGIISYTEYLFLLSVLTKPQSGFRIAFNMFDTDGNQKVDKNEFLVMEKIFSHAWRGKRGLSTETDKVATIQDQYVDDEEGLQRRHFVDTTLSLHFFGPKGNNELNFESFRQFMLNLQMEVLELEFSEFAKGLPTISEVDFAKILLRYTYLDTDEYDMYLDRLLDRIKETKGITFDEFHVFCLFLNNLEDFSIAMKMYTLADHPISKDEFHRAVKICTGTSLSPHLIHTVFAIFDDDGDGLLSYREFIAIMKDRLHRGFKSYPKNEGWEAFKICVKQEMKAA
ncbi:calcium uptake protein 3, mitochondrial isoform X2 [Coccinella septempunctata]|uniref:calcium uptake protein 3, mitochondrial isoform X2 n=1 Tax=Coccinella septempunctata TaxID=41139 RepID=UPI001D08AB5D|nr:calcium uptake protein 3, mitochondrial isoform X2 [Coccinella septempunctata]